MNCPIINYQSISSLIESEVKYKLDILKFHLPHINFIEKAKKFQFISF